MKRTMLVVLSLTTAVGLLFLVCNPSVAAVSGPCSDCHTMHNSQGGSTVVLTSEGSTDPQSALLVSDCLGCHTTTGAEPFLDGYPYVKGSGFGDSNCLAGGFFVAGTGNDSSGPNDDEAHSIGNTNNPAGYNPDETSWYTGRDDGLACAGTNGCHGNQTDLDDMDAISGGHHSPSAYRILYVGTTAVAGSGASDYEEAIIDGSASSIVTTGDDQNVNIYSAGTTSTGATISELCAKCHGDFHNGASEDGSDTGLGTLGSPWIRHPSDAPIPDEWLIDSATLTASDYKNNPVGYLNANDTNPRMVTCLSCHRAHGTENQDLLRWAYTSDDPGVLEQNAGSDITFGCLGCHDQQRGS